MTLIKKIVKAKSKEEKIDLIADLFHVLERIHLFTDGQGRTDLLVLAWLLAKYLGKQAILDHPYVSTFRPLDEWVNYLKNGMKKWCKQFSSNH